MASILTQFLAGLTPPPYVNPEEYDGLEYKWRFLVFRPALLQTEAYLLAALLLYVASIFYGKYVNLQKAKKWFAAHSEIYQQQFSNPLGKGGLVADGNSDLFVFSTGRRNVTSLHTIFTLRPRHDFFQWAFQFARTLVDLQYRPQDDLQLDFKLAPGTLPHDFVFAVIAKDELLSIKDNRWDLTFTKTSENSALPPTLSVMSEYAEITENVFKPQGTFSLTSVLSNPAILPYFRSLSVTDQPRDRPPAPIPTEVREKRVILSLIAPPPSHAADTTALVRAVFQFIDTLPKISLRPETKAKLRKTREELDKELKDESEKDKKEELSQAAEDKKAAKKRAEEERIAKLSASEQRKILEKERKRSLRKSQAQGKVVRK